jgi:type I restriction enzyme M protein
MTNPPFAGTVKRDDIRDIIRYYYLMNKNGRFVNKIGRHILFLERCIQFIRPGGRMAIVLPQGLLNNTNAEYIRRFVIDEARILAVVGLHVNTFKPHTGTKTSVLFLQKYTDEEKENIQQIRLKYEDKFKEFLENLKEKYTNLTWDSSVDEEKIPEELNSFLETYFERREEIEELPEPKDENDEGDETEEIEEENEYKKALAVLVKEKSKLDEVLMEKIEKLKSVNDTKKAELKKEIKALQKKINKLIKEISQRTLAGQINLVLNEEKITKEFKKYWLDGKVMQEVDYPIFFAVNEKPVKDESGD